MAANMKAVKLRIKSVESTMQITKAMELVASSKLRKAKERADTCRPYFQELYRTLQDIAKGNTEFYSIYAKEAKNEKCCQAFRAIQRRGNICLFLEMKNQSHIARELHIRECQSARYQTRVVRKTVLQH